MTSRKATQHEITSNLRKYTRGKNRIKFRRWVTEDRRGKSEKSTARCSVIDGRLFVASGKYAGEPLTATAITLDDGSVILVDFRIDSPYMTVTREW